jgi:hypothetical protein
MNDKQEKNVEGIIHGLVEMLFQHLPGGLRKTLKIIGQDSQFPGRDSN